MESIHRDQQSTFFYPRLNIRHGTRLGKYGQPPETKNASSFGLARTYCSINSTARFVSSSQAMVVVYFILSLPSLTASLYPLIRSLRLNAPKPPVKIAQFTVLLSFLASLTNLIIVSPQATPAL